MNNHANERFKRKNELNQPDVPIHPVRRFESNFLQAKMDEAAKATAVTMTALEASVNYITKNMKVI